jgi:hypothetical protein
MRAAVVALDVARCFNPCPSLLQISLHNDSIHSRLDTYSGRTVVLYFTLHQVVPDQLQCLYGLEGEHVIQEYSYLSLQFQGCLQLSRIPLETKLEPVHETSQIHLAHMGVPLCHGSAVARPSANPRVRKEHGYHRDLVSMHPCKVDERPHETLGPCYQWCANHPGPG